MTKIINLIGASGSGKTTIAKELEKKGYNIIQSYTTREPREENEWGHIFLKGEWYRNMSFIINKETEEFYILNNMIAYFNDYDKNEHYFATDNQVIRDAINIYIVDPSGAEQVKEYYKDSDVEVINIFLAADKITRRTRIMERECGKDNEVLLELLQALEKADERIKRDKQLFSKIAADYVIDANRSIEEVLNDVTAVIEELYYERKR